MDLYAAEGAAGNKNLFCEHWLTGFCTGSKASAKTKRIMNVLYLTKELFNHNYNKSRICFSFRFIISTMIAEETEIVLRKYSIHITHANQVFHWMIFRK